MIEIDKILRNVEYDDIEYPVDQWHPKDCGLDGFKISRFGEWYFQGSPIKRQSLVVLLSKLLKKEGTDYFVVSPVEKIKVEVDCFPFCVVLAEQDKSLEKSQWLLTLNTGEQITLGQQHPLSLYFDTEFEIHLPKIRVRRDLYASINRNVYYQWVESASENDDILSISSNGCVFRLNPDEDQVS